MLKRGGEKEGKRFRQLSENITDKKESTVIR